MATVIWPRQCFFAREIPGGSASRRVRVRPRQRRRRAGVRRGVPKNKKKASGKAGEKNSSRCAHKRKVKKHLFGRASACEMANTSDSGPTLVRLGALPQKRKATDNLHGGVPFNALLWRELFPLVILREPDQR